MRLAASPKSSEISLKLHASKQAEGKGVSIKASESGAHLETRFQRLGGEVDEKGLCLWSTAKDDPQTRFSVKATGIGRQDGDLTPLQPFGRVQTERDVVRFLRPGLVEEYSVSVDGVRQDFVIAEPPPGQGDLRVELSVVGATAQPSDRGVILVPQGSQRRLAYHRLHVVDARNRVLSAKLLMPSPRSLAVIVSDAGATYPVRIDPVFADADWVGMGFRPEPPGTNGDVYALAVDASGNLYVGGAFTEAGGHQANNVAKWDGTNWIALGDGVDGDVHALLVRGNDLYVGGWFTLAGGAGANHVAKWDISIGMWSALGDGITGNPSGGGGPLVNALVMDASGNLYAGGWFTEAGGAPAINIARWDGTEWTVLGDGLSGTNGEGIDALAIDGSDLYAGGWFTYSGPLAVNHVARWDGSSWSGLGSDPNVGTNGYVKALAVYGGTLYVGGGFTAAGGVSANSIAQWDGSAWSALGSGMNGPVDALAVDNIGRLFAGGGSPQPMASRPTISPHGRVGVGFHWGRRVWTVEYGLCSGQPTG